MKDTKDCGICGKEINKAKYLIRDKKLWACQDCYLNVDNF